jgi:amino acid permease
MVTDFKREWTCLRRSPPGKCFERRFRRVQARRRRRHEGHEVESVRIFRFTLAFILFAVGLCLLVLPLVYLPFLLAGSMLFASESLTCARALDRTEEAARSGWAWFREMTGMTPQSAKVIGLIVGIGCLALTGRCCYLAFLR